MTSFDPKSNLKSYQIPAGLLNKRKGLFSSGNLLRILMFFLALDTYDL